MEALGSSLLKGARWRRHSGFGNPTRSTLLLQGPVDKGIPRWTTVPILEAETAYSRAYCTVRLAVAVLLAMFGSDVFAMVAAFSVITVAAGAVTLTVRRTVHVLFGAMLAFS